MKANMRETMPLPSAPQRVSAGAGAEEPILLFSGGRIPASGEISLHFLGQEHQVRCWKILD